MMESKGSRLYQWFWADDATLWILVIFLKFGILALLEWLPSLIWFNSGRALKDAFVIWSLVLAPGAIIGDLKRGGNFSLTIQHLSIVGLFALAEFGFILYRLLTWDYINEIYLRNLMIPVAIMLGWTILIFIIESAIEDLYNKKHTTS